MGPRPLLPVSQCHLGHPLPVGPPGQPSGAETVSTHPVAHPGLMGVDHPTPTGPQPVDQVGVLAARDLRAGPDPGVEAPDGAGCVKTHSEVGRPPPRARDQITWLSSVTPRYHVGAVLLRCRRSQCPWRTFLRNVWPAMRWPVRSRPSDSSLIRAPVRRVKLSAGDVTMGATSGRGSLALSGPVRMASHAQCALGPVRRPVRLRSFGAH